MDNREKPEILRHKLAGMISAAVELCDEGECCESCKYSHSTACTDYLIADYLLANGVTINEWIPVSERLPKKTKACLSILIQGIWLLATGMTKTSVSRSGRFGQTMDGLRILIVSLSTGCRCPSRRKESELMKSVLISIHPEWCERIASGNKTLEVRKTCPKIEPPFKCYIYQTKAGKVGTGLFTAAGEIMGRSVKNGKVIGEFICDRLFPIHVFHNGAIQNWNYENMEDACLRYEELANYIGNDKTGYGWHISELYIYDKPIELTKFKVKRPPQSWCYVQEVDDVSS